jgi:hypothetical protein
LEKLEKLEKLYKPDKLEKQNKQDIQAIYKNILYYGIYLKYQGKIFIDNKLYLAPIYENKL